MDEKRDFYVHIGVIRHDDGSYVCKLESISADGGSPVEIRSFELEAIRMGCNELDNILHAYYESCNNQNK